MIEIDKIKVERGGQGRGYGRNIMNMICRVADEHGVTMKLVLDRVAEPFVRDWYERLGFRFTHHQHTHGPSMERQPCSSN